MNSTILLLLFIIYQGSVCSKTFYILFHYLFCTFKPKFEGTFISFILQIFFFFSFLDFLDFFSSSSSSHCNFWLCCIICTFMNNNRCTGWFSSLIFFNSSFQIIAIQHFAIFRFTSSSMHL